MKRKHLRGGTALLITAMIVTTLSSGAVPTYATTTEKTEISAEETSPADESHSGETEESETVETKAEEITEVAEESSDSDNLESPGETDAESESGNESVQEPESEEETKSEQESNESDKEEISSEPTDNTNDNETDSTVPEDAVNEESEESKAPKNVTEPTNPDLTTTRRSTQLSAPSYAAWVENEGIITWENIANADSYVIKIVATDVDSIESSSTVTTAEGTYDYLSAMEAGHTYKFRVKALSANEQYTASEYSAFSPDYVVEIPEALNDFIPATGVRWMLPDWPGWGEWEPLDTELQGQVKGVQVQIFKDDVPYSKRNFNNNYPEESCVQLASVFKESGSYQFRAAFRMTDNYEITEEQWSELSDRYTYTAPEKELPVPNGLEWGKDGSIRWNKLPHSAVEGWDENHDFSYGISLYYSDANADSEPIDTWYVPENREEPKKNKCVKFIKDLKSGKAYKFRIYMVGDVLNYADGKYSEFSSPFTMTATADTAKGKLDSLNSVDEEELQQAVEETTLSQEERKAMQEAIQKNSGAAESMKALENKYKAVSGKDLQIQSADSDKTGISSGQVSVVGGILNNAASLEIKATSINDTALNQYSKRVDIDISMDISDLNFPVMLTMPSPQGINIDRLLIFHYKTDGTVENISPRKNSDGTVSFAVTSFSPFAFVETKSSGGSGGGSGSSGGGGGSSSTVTSDRPTYAPVISGNWIKDETGWWLQKADGNYPKNQWANINQKIYRFNASGYMVEGWFTLNNSRYYLTPVSGAMATGLIIDQNKIYCLNADGTMFTGWLQLENKWYYFGSDGALMVNTVTPDGYAVDIYGAWVV